jgi:hypothetical protein
MRNVPAGMSVSVMREALLVIRSQVRLRSWALAAGSWAGTRDVTASPIEMAVRSEPVTMGFIRSISKRARGKDSLSLR